MRGFRNVAAALAACALLAACEDSTGSGARNEVRFNYSGDISGSFDARGEFPGQDQQDQEDFAVGVDLAPVFGQGTVGVLGSERVGAGLSDVFAISIYDVDEGTYSCTSNDVFNGDCPFDIEFTIGYDWDSGFDDEEYDLLFGQLRISERSGDRIRGTFSGTFFSTFDDDEVVVQNGSFDVEIRSYNEVVGSGLGQRAPAASVFPD